MAGKMKAMRRKAFHDGEYFIASDGRPDERELKESYMKRVHQTDDDGSFERFSKTWRRVVAAADGWFV